MRPFLLVVVVVLIIGFPLYLLGGVRPFCDPYAHVLSMPSARDYWIEWIEGDRAWVRHKLGRKFPLDNPEVALTPDNGRRYTGESGRLWRVSVPGFSDPFLVFDSCWGAYTMRRILFRITPGGGLVPAADFITVAEVQGDDDSFAIAATFEDADGDGVPELAESHREWITDETGQLLDNWAIRTTYHQWDGTRFRRRYERLWSCGQVGPLARCHP